MNLKRGNKMTTFNWVVWVGGSEQGQYSTLEEAEEVRAEWNADGHTDVGIEEVEFEEETPEQTNAWLQSGGW